MSTKIPIPKPEERKDIPLLDAGIYAARCFKMIHIGTNDQDFNGELKSLNKVRLYFEIPEEKIVFKEENGEQPLVVSKEFTRSLDKKANLRKFLESWRGKKFNKKELENFELTNLLGVTGMITIVHGEGKDEKIYANVDGMAKLMKGLEVEEQINETFTFGYNPFEPEKLEHIADFIVKKIKTSAEYLAATGVKERVADDIVVEDDEIDDLPF